MLQRANRDIGHLGGLESTQEAKVISKHRTKPNQRPKAEMGNECHSIFCKKPVSLCLSAQERLINTRISGSELEC